MKNLKQIILISLLAFSCNAFAQTTTVWVVRHAEKETTPGNDPELSPAGKARAAELAKKLEKQQIAAVFVTAYKRTAQTGEPTLKQAKLTSSQPYNPADLHGLANQILKFYTGKNVLIVGHSNTIIPTLAALGATKPFDTLTDDDYDLLFKITIGAGNITSLEVSYYGEKHHTTVIP